MKRNLVLFFILLFSLFIFVGCNGEDGKDGENYQQEEETEEEKEHPDEGDTAIVSDEAEGVYYTLNGNAENGPCKKPGSIIVNPFDADLFQTGPSFRGQILTGAGAFTIRGKVSVESTYAFYEAPNLTCFNEVSSGTDIGIQFFSLVDLSENQRNLNPLTTIQYFVAIEYFDDENHSAYQNIGAALTISHTDILAFLGMPDDGIKFPNMTLQGDRRADGVLGIIDSMIANGRDAQTQNAYMLDIANGVINNDLAMKADIVNQIDALPFYAIKNNLEDEYERLELGRLSPPIWEITAPAYYSDIIDRKELGTLQTLEEYNLSSTGSCSADTAFKKYAIPFVFTNPTDLKYLASNLPGSISIYSHHFDSYDRPNTLVLEIEELNEVLLDGQASLTYNGMLPEHSLTAGTYYYFVIEKDEAFILSKACTGEMLPFGRILASNDDGATWVGHNNSTSWWNRSGIQIKTFN